MTDPTPEALRATRSIRSLTPREHRYLSQETIARIIDEAMEPLRRENQMMRMTLKAVAAGIWRNKKMNACGLAGGSIVVDLVETALNPKVTP